MFTVDERPGRLAVRWFVVLVAWVVLASAPLLVPGALESRTTAAIWILLFVASVFVVPALSIAAGVLGVIAQSAPTGREVMLGKIALIGAVVVLVAALVGFGAALSLI